MFAASWNLRTQMAWPAFCHAVGLVDLLRTLSLSPHPSYHASAAHALSSPTTVALLCLGEQAVLCYGCERNSRSLTPVAILQGPSALGSYMDSGASLSKRAPYSPRLHPASQPTAFSLQPPVLYIPILSPALWMQVRRPNSSVDPTTFTQPCHSLTLPLR